jgi:hypothetical protein
MDAATVVALVAAIIAVTVPWMTFRLALRQDQIRWVREQRSQVYADLLTEACARQIFLEMETIPDDAAYETALESYTDTQLSAMEGQRMAARATIFGSETVTGLHKQAQEAAAGG